MLGYLKEFICFFLSLRDIFRKTGNRWRNTTGTFPRKWVIALPLFWGHMIFARLYQPIKDSHFHFRIVKSSTKAYNSGQWKPISRSCWWRAGGYNIIYREEKMKSRMQDKARKKLNQDGSRWTIDNNVVLKNPSNKQTKSTETVLQIRTGLRIWKKRRRFLQGERRKPKLKFWKWQSRNLQKMDFQEQLIEEFFKSQQNFGDTGAP